MLEELQIWSDFKQLLHYMYAFVLRMAIFEVIDNRSGSCWVVGLIGMFPFVVSFKIS